MTTLIPIERLTPGTLIAVPDYDGVEVYEVEFDGTGYAVRFCMDNRGGWEALDTHYVECGGCVEYAGRGEPMLREPDRAELEALDEARAARASLVSATDFFCAMLVSRSLPSLREAEEQQMEDRHVEA